MNRTLSVSVFEPVPNLRRVINLYGIVSAERFTPNKGTAIANLRVGYPLLVAPFFKKGMKQLIELADPNFTGIGKRKRDIASSARRRWRVRFSVASLDKHCGKNE